LKKTLFSSQTLIFSPVIFYCFLSGGPFDEISGLSLGNLSLKKSGRFEKKSYNLQSTLLFFIDNHGICNFIPGIGPIMKRLSDPTGYRDSDRTLHQTIKHKK